MDWWRKLRGWQKAGVIVGGSHFVLYMGILLLLPPVGGYLLVSMELPWIRLLMLLSFFPVTFLDMALLGVIGTFLYAVTTMIIGWLFALLSRRIHHGL